MPKGNVKEVLSDPEAVVFLQSGGAVAIEETYEIGAFRVVFGIEIQDPDSTYVHAICANEAIASECLGILPKVSRVNTFPEGYPVLLVNDIDASGVFDLLTEAGYEEDTEFKGG